MRLSVRKVRDADALIGRKIGDLLGWEDMGEGVLREALTRLPSRNLPISRETIAAILKSM